MFKIGDVVKRKPEHTNDWWIEMCRRLEKPHTITYYCSRYIKLKGSFETFEPKYFDLCESKHLKLLEKLCE